MLTIYLITFLKVTKAEFIKRAKEIHGDEYDYRGVPDKVENYNVVPIVCSKHGLFFQSVYNHLAGQGCFKCEHNDLNDN